MVGSLGFYRFVPEPGDAPSSAQHTAAGLDWSASPAERAEREQLLRDLLAELDERDDDRAARAAILESLGDAALMQNCYEDAIAAYTKHSPCTATSATGSAKPTPSGASATPPSRRTARRRDHAYDQALALYRDIGNRLGEANALKSLGNAARMQHRYDDAIAALDQALAVYRDIGDRHREANASEASARPPACRAATTTRSPPTTKRSPCTATSATGSAKPTPSEASAISPACKAATTTRSPPTTKRSPYRDIGNRLGEANALTSLGETARMQNRYDDAIAAYDQALPLYRDIGNRLGEANALTSLGDAARVQGRYDDAIAVYDQALALYRDVGNRLGEANV